MRFPFPAGPSRSSRGSASLPSEGLGNEVNPVGRAADSPEPGQGFFLRNIPVQTLIVIFIFCLSVLVRGYKCLRDDHLTQIPLLLMQRDPSLYRNDWFLSQFGHFDLRHYPLMVLRAGDALLGLEGGIFFFYFLFAAATIWAVLKISGRLFGSFTPGVVTLMLAITFTGREIGGNHVLEKLLIPRCEAIAFAFWALYLLLCGRNVLAGILLALAAYFQLAVGVLFFIPMLVWTLLGGNRASRKSVLYFALAFLVMLIPEAIRMSGHAGLGESASVSAGEEIRLLAYIRHPHHMIPHLWGRVRWAPFFCLLALFTALWPRVRKQWPLAGWLALFVPGLCVLLVALTVFIELAPVKFIIELQPYRLAALLHLVLFLIISPHIVMLLRSGEYIRTCRGLGLILMGYDWRLAVVFTAFEMALLAVDHLDLRAKRWGQPVLLAAALAAIAAWGRAPWGRDLWWFVAVVPMGGAALWMLAAARFYGRPKLIIRVLAAGSAISAVFFLSFFMLPYEKWAKEGNGPFNRKIAQLCWYYQIRPFSIREVEVIGDWARLNTPKGAVFITPPGIRLEGFGIWSQRAQAFVMKFIPYNRKGLSLWKERYLEFHGAIPVDSPDVEAMKKKALSDYGGSKIQDAYYHLTPGQMLWLAQKYKADFVVTPSAYPGAQFEKVFEARDYALPRSRSKPFFLYRIRDIRR